MNINAAPNSLLYSAQPSLHPSDVNSIDQRKASTRASRQALSSEILPSQNSTLRQQSEHHRPVERPNNSEKQDLNSQKKSAIEALELLPLVVEQNTNPAIKAFHSVATQEDNFHIIDVYA